MIPSYDVNTGKVYLFKTPHHRAYTHHADLPAVDAALATSAAPTYFPAHTIPGRGTFIDGGLWANCPAMVGLVEALDFLGQAPEQVRMLSLSTTSYPFRLDDPGQLRGLIGWAPKIIDTFMFGQAQAAVTWRPASCVAGSSTGSTTWSRPGPSTWTTPPQPASSSPWAVKSPS